MPLIAVQVRVVENEEESSNKRRAAGRQIVASLCLLTRSTISATFGPSWFGTLPTEADVCAAAGAPLLLAMQVRSTEKEGGTSNE